GRKEVPADAVIARGAHYPRYLIPGSGHSRRPGRAAARRTRAGHPGNAPDRPAAARRARREPGALPAELRAQHHPAPGPGRPDSPGDSPAGERLTAADRIAAGRGYGALCPGDPAQIRPERDRAGRRQGTQLPAPVGPAGPGHEPPPGDPGGWFLSPGPGP